MPEQFTGLVEFKNDAGQTVVLIDPNGKVMKAVTVIFGLDDLRARLLAAEKHLRLGIVGVGSPSVLEIMNPKIAGGTVLKFDAEFAVLDIGGQGNEGDLRIRDNVYRVRVHLDGGEGRLTMTDASSNLALRFDSEFAVLDVGAVLGTGNAGDVRVRDSTGQVRIHLEGSSGEIHTSGADCAEDFAVDPDDPPDPGTVVICCEDEVLRRSDRPFDRRVVGILSGAGGVGPGIVLGRGTHAADRLPLAISGKSWCKVDAAHGPIALGDPLTTSLTPGHAMRVDDSSRAFGAVIGKALRPWSDGVGLIPVLVSLQ